MPTLVHHAQPIEVAVPAWTHARSIPAYSNGVDRFLRTAGHAARTLPHVVHDAVVDFADDGHRSGALLLRGLPVGELPATPPTPTTLVAKDSVSEFTLLTVARRLGQPVGYEPEHGGDLIQNIVPTRAALERQVST